MHPVDPCATGIQTLDPAPKKSSAGRWIIGLVAAVVVMAAIVGLQVSQRHAIDDAAWEAGRKGANLGGLASSLDMMYDILSPVGSATDAPKRVVCAGRTTERARWVVRVLGSGVEA